MEDITLILGIRANYTLANIITAVATLTPYVRIRVSSSGMIVDCLNAVCTTKFKVRFPKSFFETYEVPDNDTFTGWFDSKQLQTALNKNSSSTIVCRQTAANMIISFQDSFGVLKFTVPMLEMASMRDPSSISIAEQRKQMAQKSATMALQVRTLHLALTRMRGIKAVAEQTVSENDIGLSLSFSSSDENGASTKVIVVEQASNVQSASMLGCRRFSFLPKEMRVFTTLVMRLEIPQMLSLSLPQTNSCNCLLIDTIGAQPTMTFMMSVNMNENELMPGITEATLRQYRIFESGSTPSVTIRETTDDSRAPKPSTTITNTPKETGSHAHSENPYANIMTQSKSRARTQQSEISHNFDSVGMSEISPIMEYNEPLEQTNTNVNNVVSPVQQASAWPSDNRASNTEKISKSLHPSFSISPSAAMPYITNSTTPSGPLVRTRMPISALINAAVMTTPEGQVETNSSLLETQNSEYAEFAANAGFVASLGSPSLDGIGFSNTFDQDPNVDSVRYDAADEQDAIDGLGTVMVTLSAQDTLDEPFNPTEFDQQLDVVFEEVHL